MNYRNDESQSILVPVNDELNTPGQNVSRLLDNVMRRYDKRVRPYYGGM